VQVRGYFRSFEPFLTPPSAGDEVIVWNLKRGLHQAINPSNGLVTALAWVPIRADVNGAFAFGCRDGLIHLYCRTGKKVHDS
jgi:hypothetical protein